MNNGETYKTREHLSAMNGYPSGIPDWMQRHLDDIDKCEDAIKTLVNFGNNFSQKSKDTGEMINDTVSCTHRTLQQGFVSAIINFIIQYGNNEYFDGRNEFTVKVAKEIRDFLDSKGYLYKDSFHAPCI